MTGKKKPTGVSPPGGRSSSGTTGTSAAGGAPEKTPARAGAGKKSAASRAPARKPTGTTASGSQFITAEERWNRIAEAAYYHAEKRGFLGGNPAEDWERAEAEIDAQLANDNIAIEG